MSKGAQKAASQTTVEEGEVMAGSKVFEKGELIKQDPAVLSFDEFEYGENPDWLVPKKIMDGEVDLDDGSKYIGQLRKSNRQPEGKGLLEMADGSTYKGWFRGGLPYGYGKEVLASGQVYEGDWIDAKSHGTGTIWFENGAKYKGDFFANKRHGQGLETYKNGCHFRGEFAADEKHGAGVYVWPDGRIYDGAWCLGKRHGEAYFTNRDGTRIHCFWTEGKCTRVVDDEDEVMSAVRHGEEKY